MRVRTEGIDLEDGGQPDDIWVFATSSQQAAYLLDELVVALADVGLILNQDKTKLIRHKLNHQQLLRPPED